MVKTFAAPTMLSKEKPATTTTKRSFFSCSGINSFFFFNSPFLHHNLPQALLHPVPVCRQQHACRHQLNMNLPRDVETTGGAGNKSIRVIIINNSHTSLICVSRKEGVVGCWVEQLLRGTRGAAVRAPSLRSSIRARSDAGRKDVRRAFLPLRARARCRIGQRKICR